MGCEDFLAFKNFPASRRTTLATNRITYRHGEPPSLHGPWATKAGGGRIVGSARLRRGESQTRGKPRSRGPVKLDASHTPGWALAFDFAWQEESGKLDTVARQARSDGSGVGKLAAKRREAEELSEGTRRAGLRAAGSGKGGHGDPGCGSHACPQPRFCPPFAREPDRSGPEARPVATEAKTTATGACDQSERGGARLWETLTRGDVVCLSRASG